MTGSGGRRRKVVTNAIFPETLRPLWNVSSPNTTMLSSSTIEITNHLMQKPCAGKKMLNLLEWKLQTFIYGT